MPDWGTISGLCPDDILPAAGRYHRFAVTISAPVARTEGAGCFPMMTGRVRECRTGETISGLCPDDILPVAGRYHRFAVTISAPVARTLELIYL